MTPLSKEPVAVLNGIGIPMKVLEYDCVKLTQERAEQIWEDVMASRPMIGCSYAAVHQYLEPGQERYIHEIWQQMTGYASWASAFDAIRLGRVSDDGVYLGEEQPWNEYEKEAYPMILQGILADRERIRPLAG